MAGKRISELTAATSVAAADVVPVTQGWTGPDTGTTRLVSLSQIGSGAPVTATGSTTARTPAARAADVLSVLDFGAVVDGVTDDTAAILAAIAAAAALGKGVQLAQGTSIITALTIPTGLKFLRGYGASSSILKRKAAAAAGYMVYASGLAFGDFIGFTLDGNVTAQTNFGGNALFSNCYGLLFEKVAFTNAKGVAGLYGWGLRLDPQTTAPGNPAATIVRNCGFSGNDGHGFELNGAFTNIDIISCSSTSNSVGFQIGGSSTNIVKNVKVEACSALSNSGTGILLNGITDPSFDKTGISTFVVSGNICTGNVGYGIAVDGVYGTVSGNQVVGNGTTAATSAGILCNGSNVLITGNFVKDNQVFGVDAGGGDHVTIIGNEITGSYATNANSGCGIDLNGCLNCVVSGNLLKANGNGASGTNNGSEIAVASFDGGGVYPAFPIIQNNAQIFGNTIIVSGNNAFGIYINSDAKNVKVSGNSFFGGDENKYTYNLSSTTALSGNFATTALGSASCHYMAAAAGALTVPDFADVLVLTTSAAAIITSIQTSPQLFYSGKVTSGSVTSAGTGYATSGTLACVITGDGTGAAAYANPNAQGGIGGITMTNSGSGYTTASISVAGGAGFVGVANIGALPLQNGRSLTVVNNSGASQTLAVSGNIRATNAIVIPDGASVLLLGFSNKWNASISAGFGSGAGPEIVVTASGALTVTDSNIVLFENTANISASLPNGTVDRTTMTFARQAAGFVAFTGNINGTSGYAISMSSLNGFEALTLRWSTSRATWLIMSYYDPGQRLMDLPLVAANVNQTVFAVQPDGITPVRVALGDIARTLATSGTLTSFPTTGTNGTALNFTSAAVGLSPSGATGYLATLLGGVQQGARVAVTAGSPPAYTPSSAGTYAFALFQSSTGGTAFQTTPNITVS